MLKTMWERAFGGTVMTGLLLGAIAVAAIPVVVGFLVATLVPEVGELRDGSGWRILHFLWIYPAVFFLAMVNSGVATGLTRRDPHSGLNGVVTSVVLWFGLALMLTVFFKHVSGAAIASAVALLVFWPFVRLLERGAEAAERRNDGGAEVRPPYTR